MIEDIDNDLVMIIQEDSNLYSTIQLKELAIGEQFIFRDNLYQKISDYGWYFAYLNVLKSNATKAHLHPTTKVTLIQ